MRSFRPAFDRDTRAADSRREGTVIRPDKHRVNHQGDGGKYTLGERHATNGHTEQQKTEGSGQVHTPGGLDFPRVASSYEVRAMWSSPRRPAIWDPCATTQEWSRQVLAAALMRSTKAKRQSISSGSRVP